MAQSILQQLQTQHNLTATQRFTLATAIWSWYEEHKEMKLFDVSVLFIKVGVKLKTCKPLLELIFGPQP